MVENVERNTPDDDVLNTFFSEIESIDRLGNSEKEDANAKFDATETCLRLVSRTFSSPFQVLQLGPNASEDDIKKRYRKLSLLIHPDKFKHERAQEAFHVLVKAFNEIQDAGIREKFKNVYEEAKVVVFKRYKLKPNAETLDLIASGILDSDLQKIENEIHLECEEMLRKQQERREYAEKCIKANIEYEKKMAAEQMELERQKLYQQIEWDKTRDIRVNSWRDFQARIDSKDFKLAAFKGIERKREVRDFEPEFTKGTSITASKTQRQQKRKKITSEQLSYKEHWR